YSSQRLIAQQAMLTGDEKVLSDQTPGEKSTIAIRNEHMGKAIGLRIYHNKNGAVIETLGDFHVAAFVLSPVLADFGLSTANDQHIRPLAGQIEDKHWQLLAADQHKTVATHFRNEPSPMQIREIPRLHHDFEIATSPLLRQGQPDSSGLAYPFQVFV